jgi:hypothetical protein
MNSVTRMVPAKPPRPRTLDYQWMRGVWQSMGDVCVITVAGLAVTGFVCNLIDMGLLTWAAMCRLLASW